MRYRRLSPEGDYTFGHGQGDFHVDSPEAVAQAVVTRLALLTGEWFLDIGEGTPYLQEVIGNGTQATYDAALKQRILTTEGVTELADYSSEVIDRHLSVRATINTIFGVTTLSFNVQGSNT